MRLTLLVGPPGSGKTMKSKELENFGYIRISQDDQGKTGHLEKFKQALDNKNYIVVDRMNFSKEQRDRYIKPAKELGYDVVIEVLHVPYKLCLERCKARTDHPTIKSEKEALLALKTFFTKYERVGDFEADEVNRHGWTKEVNPCIWVDMDNTLSNASHREHFVSGPKKNWKGFFDAMSEDPKNEWCHTLIEGMQSVGVLTVICSARPEEYRRKTEVWLYNNKIAYDELIMRHSGDYRKDNIVKEIMLEFEIKPRYQLVFAVDDRKQVIDYIRKHGITVLDCAGNEF